MNVLEFSLLVWLGSLAAGLLGALTGLGGGVVVVPFLLALSVDMRYAIGAALVSVIATSSGAAAAYVKEGYTNMRVGMFLEMATTCGALCGAYLGTRVLPTSAIAVVFGVVLLSSAWLSFRKREDRLADTPDRLATLLRLDGGYPSPTGWQTYHVQHVPIGFGLMYIAGVLSGLLGIGSGAVKVLALDQAMRMPFKASTTTSNFMIGVTAAASAGLYLHDGYISPGLSMPVMLGILPGALIGSKLLARANVGALRIVFAVVIAALAIQMIYLGLTGRASAMSDWNDQRIEQFLGNVLRVGVILSATIVLLGAVVYLARHGTEERDYTQFRGEPPKYTSMPDIASAAWQGEGRAIIQLGILLLLATPVARVALSAVGFGLERDKLYVFFTLVVLTLLLLSLSGVAV